MSNIYLTNCLLRILYKKLFGTIKRSRTVICDFNLTNGKYYINRLDLKEKKQIPAIPA